MKNKLALGKIIEGPSEVKFKVSSSIYTPFLDWNYRPEKEFSASILDVPSGWCSGSPFVMAEKLFAGYVEWEDGEISYDGKGQVKFKFGKKQKLYVYEGKETYSALEEYNSIIFDAYYSKEDMFFGDPDLLSSHEYCTWVEQRYSRTAGTEMGILSDKFIRNYLGRVQDMKLPPGKFTIDAGWFNLSGEGGIGDWVNDKVRFPDLAKTADMIKSFGHTPGIWLAPSLVSNKSRLYSKVKDRIKDHYKWLSPDVPGTQEEYGILPDCELTRKHYRKVLQNLFDAGYRKFKLDIFYIEKRKMLPVVKLFREIAAEVDSGIELEAHLPDIFLSKYINAVRANDIWINDAKSFAFGPEHFRICRLCSPHRVTNLDHIGGNGFLSEKDYVNAHLGTMFTVPGYPVVSVLPDRFGRNTVELVKKLLEEYSAKRKQYLNLVYSRKPGIY
ncbi:MAG TPA: hypothetical protein DET40_22095 [Lentisphaeria bacterium]|nr:MAG: hypothetical protein A2X45_04185 [Lentisphaerae bacterium GWF2_50_93]HCE46246.1 hypothetical protein [Lentisphaeria bacterium]